jgi:hypothetical protein
MQSTVILTNAKEEDMNARFRFLWTVPAIALCMLFLQTGSLWSVPGEWEMIAFDDESLADIAIDMTNAETMLIGKLNDAESGAYRTTDGGDTWEMINDTIGNKTCQHIIEDPNDSACYVFLTSNSNKIYKTTNHGDKWWEGKAGPAYNFLQCAEFDPSDSKILYAGGSNGLYRTTNGGISFSAVDIGITDQVNSIAVDPTNSDIVYVGAATMGLHKSTDFGVSWEKKSSGFGDEDCEVQFIRVNPNNPDTLYAACHWGGAPGTSEFYISTDAAENWTALAPTYQVTDFFLAADSPNILILGTNNDAVAYSSNAGGSWATFSKGFGGNPPWIYGVEPDRQQLDIMYAATSNGLWRLEVNLLPGKPENIAAENKQEGILVSWDPVTENEDGSPCDDLYGYVVRRNNLPGPETVIIDTLVYTGDTPTLYDYADEDPTLTEGNAYRYQVQAIDVYMAGGDWSEWSGVIMYEPVGINVSLMGKLLDSSVELRWNIHDHSQYSETRIYRKTGDQELFQLLTSLHGKEHSYVDESVKEMNRYSYRIGLATETGEEIFSNSVTLTMKPSPVVSLMLGPNAPNPFNPRTTIDFDIPEGKSSYNVILKIYNARGELVKQLFDDVMKAGHYSVVWDGLDQSGNAVPSGTYYYVLNCDEMKQMRKMLLVK